MESVALAINLVLFGLFTVVLVTLSIGEARQEKKDREELKKAA